MTVIVGTHTDVAWSVKGWHSAALGWIADVLATNIRPAAMERLGLGYARLAEVNPRLIYASMVGFSQKGPYGPKAAYDDMMQAATGLSAVMAEQGEG